MEKTIRNAEFSEVDLNGKFDAAKLGEILENAIKDDKYDTAFIVLINHDNQNKIVIPIGNPIGIASLLASGTIEESIYESQQELLSKDFLDRIPLNMANIIKLILEKSEKIIN